MSTDISALSVDISGGRYSSLSDVNNRHESGDDLADFVKRIRFEKELSQRDVERKSEGAISKGYIGQIENRDVLGQSITPQKLRALAKGLGVAEDVVFAYARGKSPEPMSPHDFISALEALGVEQFSAYGGLQKLSREDQQEIIAMVEAMVEQKLKRKKPGK